jgi:hypothetical protein
MMPYVDVNTPLVFYSLFELMNEFVDFVILSGFPTHAAKSVLNYKNS